MSFQWQRNLESKIIKALKENPGPQTIARIAYYIDNTYYEKGDELNWRGWKSSIGAQLNIMHRQEKVIKDDSRKQAGYVYWELPKKCIQSEGK